MRMKLYIVITIFLFGCSFVSAQDTKEDIEKEAQSFFKKRDFIEATPLFLRLLSLEPRNPNYNYKYGTCLLYNADKKNEAFKYLNYSIQKDSEVEDEAYFYLGKAYHLTYRFSKAIKNYELYKQRVGSRVLADLQVDRQIEMCRNGKTQFNDISETIVLEKTKIDLKSFFRIYDLKDIGGVLIVTEEFQNKQDKKNNHTPLIHFPVNSDYIYYSSFGQDSNNKDIYFRYRTSDGDWSKESKVLGDVNTPFNEDYPYMHPNGKYLYFSSEGHNSLGGYDVFRSILDPSTNSFGKPENMNISISSPGNDFLYIVDSLEKNAYFASQRESELDNVHVYKVRVERMPMEMIVLKGDFNSIINPSQKSISLKVNDVAGDLMGIFTSNSKGEFIVNLPKNGKYEFVVIIDKSDKEHKEIIEIPDLESFRPLKIDITEIDKDGESLVVFKRLFDEKIENYDEIIAEAIANKAKMSVNKNQFNLDSLDRIKDQKRSFEKIGLSQYTNVEIQDLIKTKFKDLYTRQSSTDSLIQKSKYIVQTGNKSIKNTLVSADSLIKLSKEDPNNSLNDKWNKLAEQNLKKSKNIQKEVLDAQVILSFLEEDYIEKEALVSKAKSLNNDISNISTKNNANLVRVLTIHTDFVSKELLVRTNTNAHFEYLSVINEELRQRDQLIKRKDSLMNEEKATAVQIEKLERDYELASKKNKEDISFELSKAQIKLESLRSEVQYTNEEIEEKGKIAERKEILAQIVNSPIKENTLSQHELAEDFESLKNELREIENKTNSTFKEDQLAETDEQSQFNEENEEKEDLIAENQAKETDDNSNVPSETSKDSSIDTKTEVEEGDITEENENTEIIPTLFVIDPTYADDVAKINSGIEDGVTNKSELVNRKNQAISKVQNSKSIVVEQISENPEKSSLEKTIQRLNILEEKLFNEVATLNAEIDLENELFAENKEIQNENTVSTNEQEKKENTLVENANDLPNNDNNSNESSDKQNSTPVPLAAITEKDTNAISEIDIEPLETDSNIENEMNELINIESENSTTETAVNEIEESPEEAGQLIEKDEIDATPTPLISEIDPDFTQDIAQIESDVSGGNQSKEELIKRRYQAALKVDESKKKMILLQAENPENISFDEQIDALSNLEIDIYKEIEAIEDELTEEKERIAGKQKIDSISENEITNETEVNEEIIDTTLAADTEAEMTDSSVVSKPINSEKLAATFNSISAIDSAYSVEIVQLENEVSTGNSDKSALVDRKNQVLLKVLDLKEETITQKSNNPEDETLGVKIDNLTRLENKLQNEIEALEDEIALENEMIAQTQEQLSNENNSANETEVNEEIIDTNLAADTEAETNLAINNLEGLKNKEDKGDKVDETETTVALDANSNTSINDNQEIVEPNIALSNPKDLLKELDPSYLSDIAEIERGIEEGSQSNKELIKRKYKVLISVGDVKSETIKEEETNPTPLLKQKIETLNTIESQIITEIDDLENEGLMASKQSEAKENVNKEQSSSIKSRESVPEELIKNISSNEKKLLDNLFDEKEQLESELASNPELAKDKKFKKELTKVEDKLTKEINNAFEKSIVSSYPTLYDKTYKLVQKSPEELDVLESQQSITKIEILLQKIENSKNPNETNTLLQQAFNEQVKIKKLVNDAYTQRRIDGYVEQIVNEGNLENIETEKVAVTEDLVLIEQEHINMKLLNLNDQINELNEMIPFAKKEQLSLIDYSIDQLKQVIMGFENKYYSNQKILNKNEEQRVTDANKGISKEANKNILTYKEEVEIAQSAEYIDQLKNNNRLNQAQYELRIKEEQLRNQQNEMVNIYDKIKASKTFSEEQKESINLQLVTISETKKDVEEKRSNVQAIQNVVAESLPEDAELRYKTENLIARDVAPINEIPVKTPRMAKIGLVIGEKKENKTANVQPIQMIESQEDQMGGLIFRVQIGAFKKPVSNSTFNEFSPISGDKVASGWIKYVVGLFGDNETASEAREKIRTMGYSDAFVVAYCDGERIPVYRALQLIESGACIPLINNEEDLIAETNADSLTQNTTPELDETAYNKSFGAAEADVVETKKGLFYTVQIGVYNTPATSEQLNNISPLITKRLPNGVLRYSSGIFNTYEEALPKKQEATDKGITDAYIVAYYNGVRISASEANKILSSKGEAVLESKTPTKKIENEMKINGNETQEAFINDRNIQRILVSSERYMEYPDQELNRYNEYGELFYYDTKTKHIQSFLFEDIAVTSQFSNEFSVQRLFNFAYPVVDYKTAYRQKAIENSENNLIHLEVTIKNEDLNSDLMEAILNAPAIRKMKTNKNELVVDFYAIDIENNIQIIDRLQANLNKLGASKINKTIKSF